MTHLTVLFYVIQATICMSFYVFFIIKTLQNKLRQSMKNTIFFAILYIVSSVTTVELFYEKISPFSQFRQFAGPIWAVLSVCLAAVIFTIHPLQLTFIVFAFFGIHNNVMMMARSMYLLNITPKIFKTDELNYLFLTLLVLFSITPLMWYLFVKIGKKVIELELAPYYWRTLFIIPLTYFLFCWFSTTSTQLLDGAKPWEILGMLVFLNICTYLSYVAVFKMLLKTYESQKAIEKNKLAEQLLALQREQYETLAENVVQNAKLRHDFRHHIVAIRGFVDDNNLEGLSAYLDTYQQDHLAQDSAIFCENYFVNIILRHYAALADEHGIKITIKVEISENFPVLHTELCVLFGNLIENAFESCMRQKYGEKYINITSKLLSQYMLTIAVTNSYDDVILCRGEDFLSNKHQGTGFGIASIRSISEKNGGSCKFSFSNHVFKAYVLLVSKT